ncbi:MAG: TlpA family protein disulfide reductase [Candidatus Eremiobacteraeota bacterium]|nr:TlpA family protein disulfide reductase [Candidatus Eremiobacteraeota bacterium]
MSRYILWALAAAIAAIAFIVLEPFFAPQATHTVGPSALSGERAPVIPLLDDRGRSVSLAVYRGRVVLINLWASWCPPCRAEMPDLQRLANAHANDGIAIVGVNEGESPQRARAFADSLGIRFPIWMDETQRYGRTYALGLPTTVILDRHGIVVRGFDGALTYSQMEAAIRPLMRAP